MELPRRGRGVEGPGSGAEGLQAPARARRGQTHGLRPPGSPASLELARCARVSSGFFPFFFFLRGAELMLVNKSLSLAALLPPPPPLPHTGGWRARAWVRAHAPARPREPPPPQPRRAQGPAQPGARQEPEPWIPGTCGAEPEREVQGGEAPPPPPARAHPDARSLARARAPPPRSRPHPHCAGHSARALPSRKTPKTMSQAPVRARERGPSGERRRGGRGVGGECGAREVH